MRYLARREHSRTELRSKLLPYVQESDDLDAVLDDLIRRDYLSDARAAEQMINQRRRRFGTQRITHELRQKVITDVLIDDAIPQLKATELETARDVWQRKFGIPPQDQKEKAKQARFMQSRGFSMDIIFKVLRLSEVDEIVE